MWIRRATTTSWHLGWLSKTFKRGTIVLVPAFVYAPQGSVASGCPSAGSNAPPPPPTSLGPAGRFWDRFYPLIDRRAQTCVEHEVKAGKRGSIVFGSHVSAEPLCPVSGPQNTTGAGPKDSAAATPRSAP